MSEKVPNRKAGADARAKVLSPQQRRDIARRAAAARWGVPLASHEGMLNLAGWRNIPCWVLDDQRRIISQRSFMEIVGMKQGSAIHIGHRISQILDPKNLKSETASALINAVENPIRFLDAEQLMSNGYDGAIIADFCNAVLYARRTGNLAGAVLDYADQAERLLVALAKTSIVSLIDGATGYQEVRDRFALQKILEQYITDEWAKWSRRFKPEFYKELFRLKGIPFPPSEGTQKPSCVGHWTNDLVYSRLAPGILKKLREVNPRTASGTRARKHHQHLTDDVGVPELQDHLSNVTFLMKTCQTWEEFKQRLDIAAARYGDTMSLSLNDPLRPSSSQNQGPPSPESS